MVNHILPQHWIRELWKPPIGRPGLGAPLAGTGAERKTVQGAASGTLREFYPSGTRYKELAVNSQQTVELQCSGSACRRTLSTHLKGTAPGHAPLSVRLRVERRGEGHPHRFVGLVRDDGTILRDPQLAPHRRVAVVPIPRPRRRFCPAARGRPWYRFTVALIP
jgi:hypothetical protein